MLQSEDLLRKVIGTQYFAVLNSLGGSLPYSNLVSFAVTEDLSSLVFVTNRNTRKYRNIRENPNVSLLIDNRNNRPSDIKQAVAITVIGTAQEKTDNRTPYLDIFLAKHPHLKRFLNALGNALILVSVNEYIIAGFDKTQRIVLSE